MGTLARDLAIGLRFLAKTPAVTAVAILSLGLGIGANTAIFTIVNALFFHTIPVRDPANLLHVRAGEARATCTPLQKFNLAKLSPPPRPPLSCRASPPT